MKVVFDINGLISALITKGKTRMHYKVEQRQIQFVLSKS
jgi:predicted nucleic acid-binding protein